MNGSSQLLVSKFSQFSIVIYLLNKNVYIIIIIILYILPCILQYE